MDDIGTLVLQVREGQIVEIGNDITVCLRRGFGKDGGTYTSISIRAPRSVPIELLKIKPVQKNIAAEVPYGN